MTKLKPEEQVLKMIVCGQIICDNIEAAEKLGFFNRQFKYYANRFIAELEKIETKLFTEISKEENKELVELGQVFYNSVDKSIDDKFKK